MIKQILIVLLVSITFVFSGCGSSNGESQLEIQEMLDNGNYDAVINRLKDNASSSSDYVALASAYMGRAGFSLSDIVTRVATSADDDNDAFTAFIQNSTKQSNSKTLNDLEMAGIYFKKVVNCNDSSKLSSSQKDICLYVGLSKVSKTAVTVGYIADDVSVLSEDGEVDDKLTASLCAMQYAIDPNEVDTKCSISNQGRDITFTQTNRTYECPTFIVNGKGFDNLITKTDPKSTVITNGICTLDDFATRVKDKNDSDYNNSLTYYPCPVNESNDSNDITTQSVLVDALNDGVDSIGAAVSDDVKEDVDEFKKDVLEANNRGNDENTTIAIDDILKYLEDNNK